MLWIIKTIIKIKNNITDIFKQNYKKLINNKKS